MLLTLLPLVGHLFKLITCLLLHKFGLSKAPRFNLKTSEHIINTGCLWNSWQHFRGVFLLCIQATKNIYEKTEVLGYFISNFWCTRRECRPVRRQVFNFATLIPSLQIHLSTAPSYKTEDVCKHNTSGTLALLLYLHVFSVS